MDFRCHSMIECLPSMNRVLCSTPSTSEYFKKKKKKLQISFQSEDLKIVRVRVLNLNFNSLTIYVFNRCWKNLSLFLILTMKPVVIFKAISEKMRLNVQMECGFLVKQSGIVCHFKTLFILYLYVGQSVSKFQTNNITYYIQLFTIIRLFFKAYYMCHSIITH